MQRDEGSFPGLPLRHTSSGKHRFKEGVRVYDSNSELAIEVSDSDEQEPAPPVVSPPVAQSKPPPPQLPPQMDRSQVSHRPTEIERSQMLRPPGASPRPGISGLVNELKGLPLIPDNELYNITQVVQKANVMGQTPEERTRNMQALFNCHRTELFMVESRVIGSRVDPGNVRIIHLNNVPEMVTCYDGPREFRPGKGLDVREDLGTHRESELFYGAKGMYVVNVPQGKYALAWIGTEPLILDQGTHVLSSPQLLPVQERSLVDQTSMYVRHGNTHILRLPPGKVACITLNNEPYILESQKEPYVFRNPLFNFDARTGFVDANRAYIRNGSLHVLQVPKGRVCTAWEGAKPLLLYHKEEGPYLIRDNLFRVQPRSGQELFYDATDEIISHGSINRIIPRTGHVAVVYIDGHLNIIRPTADGRPIIIDHERVIVGEMLNVQKQTLRFPSEKTRRERERELAAQGLTSPDDKKIVNYELFTTNNGARYGVKLLVVFTITDPLLALTNFRPEDIVPHVENLVVTEMNKAIQATESTAFLQSRSKAKGHKAEGDNEPVYENAQDEIKAHLHRDLLGVGIDVDRVSIEESIPIDKALIEQMAQFAVRNKKITLEVALLERESQIVEQQARRVALQRQIALENELALKLQKARADLEVAKLQVQTSNALTAAYVRHLSELDTTYTDYPALLKVHLAEAIYAQTAPVSTPLPLAPLDLRGWTTVGVAESSTEAVSDNDPLMAIISGEDLRGTSVLSTNAPTLLGEESRASDASGAAPSEMTRAKDILDALPSRPAPTAPPTSQYRLAGGVSGAALSRTTSVANARAAKLAALTEAGFTEPEARRALKKFNDDLEQAMTYLLDTAK